VAPFALRLLVAAVLAFTDLPALAQFCGPQWLPGPGRPGFDSTVHASAVWDPDCPGPQEPLIVAGGDFTIAGGVLCSRVVAWNPRTREWLPLGAGFNSTVFALAVLSTGELVAGGSFTSSGSTPVSRIARWNGSEWTPLGVGMDATVKALTIDPGGDLIAGGAFTSAGGVPASRMARWNGTSWSPLPLLSTISFSSFGTVNQLAFLTNGDMIAGGIGLSVSGGLRGVVRWNGSEWSGFPGSGGNSSIEVLALAPRPGGTFIIGGGWSNVPDQLSIQTMALWNGTEWAPVASIAGTVSSITNLPNGNFVVAGAFPRINGITCNGIAEWNGSAWTALGPGLTTMLGMVRTTSALPDGSIFAAGSTLRIFELDPPLNAAFWSASRWSLLGDGLNGRVHDIEPFPDGSAYVAGRFTIAGGTLMSRIARWANGSWQPLTTGVNGDVYCLTSTNSGDLIAAGTFSSAGGVPASNIARWNGSAWSAISGTMSNSPSFESTIGLCSDRFPNGDIVIAGRFRRIGTVNAVNVARWDGSTWHPYGTGHNRLVRAILARSDGSLVAGGDFSTGGAFISQWNGSGWIPVGAGFTAAVHALAEMPNGDLIAGGDFTSTTDGIPVSRIARWNGTTWTALGSGFNNTVSTLLPLPNGQLIAAGLFTAINGESGQGVALWDGFQWAPLQSGLPGPVFTLAETPNGEILAGGDFQVTTGLGPASFARWTLNNNLWLASQPLPQTASAGNSITFTASLAPGLPETSFQWRRNGTPVVPGPGGASPAGGTVRGASGLVPSVFNPAPISLHIDNVQPSDAGAYSVVFFGPCSSAISQPASLTVSHPCPCPSDINCDSGSDSDDVILFFAAWDSNLPLADFNLDLAVDSDDVIAFFLAWDAGC